MSSKSNTIKILDKIIWHTHTHVLKCIQIDWYSCQSCLIARVLHLFPILSSWPVVAKAVSLARHATCVQCKLGLAPPPKANASRRQSICTMTRPFRRSDVSFETMHILEVWIVDLSVKNAAESAQESKFQNMSCRFSGRCPGWDPRGGVLK